MTADLLYNIGPGRDRRVVAREVEALLDEYRPRVLGLVEAIGYPLTKVAGYRLIRDTSRDGRANIAAYVKDGPRLRVRWVDLHATWARTEMPGTHPARSILRLTVGGQVVVVAHAPPKTRMGEGSSVPARREHFAALVRLMAPWRRVGR